MEYLRIKLKPKSFLHLGEREGWLEGSKIHIPSDTIFSALCHCHLLLYGEVDSFIQAFKEEPPFLLSSAFPYWEDELYFPLPKNQMFGNVKSSENGKELKKVKFVNLKLLLRLLNNEHLEDLEDEIDKSQELDCLPRIDKKERAGKKLVPWEVEDVPRIALSRFNNHPGENFFHFGQVHFAENSGLFILVNLKDESWENKVRALFNLLADEGIGGDRTAGKGLFYPPEFDRLFIPEVSEANASYAVSTYFPRDEELVGLEKGFYELEVRKGYIFSLHNRSYRRRSLRLFSEGSIFPAANRKGALVDITPEVFTAHRVYRYGFLFSFPCKMEEQ
ncbi:MAG: type III-A CRISPR-associated RAMP protein Csm4 [Candidatus Aminicenantes bacterium]|nr:type III-A CRISPR-associated RAMP protein Csm4 [Candidatus Aminicenantes bacterium]